MISLRWKRISLWAFTPWLLTRVPDDIRDFLVLATALTAVGAGLYWMILGSPPEVAAALVLGGIAATIWLLSPVCAAYTLALLCPFMLYFDLGPLRGVRVQDGVLGTMAVGLFLSLLNGSPRGTMFRNPLVRAFLGIWVFLVVWLAITFLLGVANAVILRDPIRNTWYLYNLVWRDLLPLPLVLCSLRTHRETRRALGLTILVTTLVAAYAIYLAWMTGKNATGHFQEGYNQLAAFLVLVIPFAAARLVLANGWRQRLAYGVVFAILFRALWLTGSRGGLVAFLASLVPLALFVPHRRLLSAAGVGFLILSLYAVTRDDLLNRPMVQRFLTLSRASEESTFKWRQEQWELFLQRVKEHPWIGTGSGVDEAVLRLGRAATAHNAFLDMAVRSGLPGMTAWIVLLMSAGILSARRVLSAFTPMEERVFWVGFSGFLVALVTHGMVEVAFQTPQVQQLFWIVVGLALVVASAREAAASKAGAHV